MSNSKTTVQFTEAVAAYKEWDAAIDAYLSDPGAGASSPTEQAAHDVFQVAFTRLCNVRSVYRGVPACRRAEDYLWDQVAEAAQA